VLGCSAWEELRDVLADLWDWWAEGVHLRPQYDAGHPITEPFALEVVRQAMPRVPQEESAPPRTVTIDSNLGEGLFQLNVALHFEIARTKEVLGPPSGSVPELGRRRCQTVVRTAKGEWVRFAPGVHPALTFSTTFIEFRLPAKRNFPSCGHARLICEESIFDPPVCT
jgi:hypothetical protein